MLCVISRRLPEQDWSRKWEALKWTLPVLSVSKKLDNGSFQEHGCHQCHCLANGASG